MPKLLRLLVRNTPVVPETLPVVTEATPVPANTPLVAYLAGGPRRMTLLRTAAFLVANGFSVTAPATAGGEGVDNVATLTGISFVSAGTVRAGAAAGTLLGSLGVSATGANPTGLTFALVSTTPLDVRIVGDRVQLNSGTVQAGDLTFRVKASASNGNPIERNVTVTIAPALAAPTGPTGPLAIGFRIKAVADVPANSPITFFQPFAPGDLYPTESIVVETAAGAALTAQQDQEVYWDNTMPNPAHNGSVRGVAISFLTSALIPAGTIASFVIKKTSAAPNRTPYTSLAATKSSSDVHLKLYGLDLGADTMLCAFNQITTDFLQPDAAGSWGDNPLGGWEVIRSGPICVEWLVWRYTNKLGDFGRTHKWQKAQVYLRLWSNGAREITPVVTQPNAYAANRSGTIGPDVQTRVACYAELWDGPNRIYTYAGPDAPSAFTVDATAFSGATNRLTLPAGKKAKDYWGERSAVGFSGALPSGFNEATTYFPYNFGDATNPDFNLARTLGGAYAGMGTPQASGTVRVMPALATYPACGAVLMTEEGHPVMTGTPRPRYLPALDEVYLTRKSTLTLPYDLSVSRPASDATTGERWKLGSTTDELINNDKGSDDPYTDRIGYLPVTSANLIVLPFDGYKDLHCRRLALQYANYTIWLEDQRSGRQAISDNGPADNGTPYLGFGPCNPTLGMHRFNGPTGSPAWGGSSLWNPGGNDPGHSGYNLNYGVPTDPSHLPDYLTMPYLRTGHHVYAALSAATSAFVHATYGGERRQDYGNGKVFYSGMIRTFARNQAWTLRTLGTTRAILPSSHPYSAVLQKQLNSYSECVRRDIESSPFQHLGITTGGSTSSPWQHCFNVIAVAMEVWRGAQPEWKPVLLNYIKLLVRGFSDDIDVPNGGYMQFWYSQMAYRNYDTPPKDGAIFPSISAMFTQASYFAPFQSSGFYPSNTPNQQQHGINPITEADYDILNAYPKMHHAALAMVKTLNDAGIVSSFETQNAGRVRDQQIARCIASGKPAMMGPYIPGDAGSAVMTYAVVPI